eukprot:6479613-Amphidinium_carterae.2
MNRVRLLGLPATSKARIVKSLFCVGLYGAEVGGMSASHMNDVETPPCVKLHGLLPAPMLPAILTHEPALVNRAGVVTVWTDGWLTVLG